MSLSSFINQRLQQLHNDVHAVVNPIQRDVVAPIQRNVVAPIVHTVIPPVQHTVVAPLIHAGGNIVNAGATAARDFGGAAEATGRFMAATPNHNVVLPAVEQAAKATVHHFAVDLPKSAYDIGRGAAASLTNNRVALQHANQAKAKDEGAFLQPVSRPLAQTAETIVHPLSAHTVTPQSAQDKIIFGKTPIQNINAGVASNYDQHKNLPAPQRLLLAGAYGTGQVAQDVGAVAGVKGAGHVLAHGAVDTGTAALNTAKDIATAKPFRNISDAEVAAANRVSMARSGFPDNTKPTDIQTYRGVQQKLGVDPNNHGAVDNLIGSRMTYDTRMSQRPGFLGTQGGGKGTQFTGDSNLLPHQNFEKEYADALKQMETGATGGQMVPDGQGGYTRMSEHSPFYRQVYAQTGKAPTNAHWLAEAQRQLQSGKADSYAQKEYNDLKAQAPQSDHIGTYNVTPQAQESLTRAYNWNSFNPEKAAANDLNSTKQYVEGLYQKYAPQAEKHGRIDEFNQLFQKFKDHVQKSNADITGKLSRVASPMVTGPAKFNFARNTARKNTHMNAVSKYLDTNKKFENQFERIARNEQAPVKVGDKGAVSATQSELQKAQEKQAAFKEINQRLRKGEPVESVLKSYPEHVTEGLKGARSYLNSKDYKGNAPGKIPGYALTNLNATVKRLATKANTAAKVEGASVDHLHIPGASVTIDKEANRLRVAHDTKPDAPVIKDMKSMGLRWSPKNSAWQAPVTPRLLRGIEDYAKRVAPAEQKKPLQFGNAAQVKQAKVANEAGKVLEQNKARVQDKATATPQHNATTLFDHNSLLKSGGQSDIFSSKPVPMEDIPKAFTEPLHSAASIKDQVKSGPAPKTLPEQHESYFNMGKVDRIVPLDKLVSAKSDAENVKGGGNAPKFMEAARTGVMGKRDPITVTPLANGKYKIADGNGTYTGVKKYGWSSLPVQVKHVDEPGTVLHAAKSMVKDVTPHNDDFQKNVREVAAATGNRPLEGPIKSAARIAEKAANDYSGDLSRVKDAVRATIEVSDPSKISHVVDEIKKRYGVTSPVKNGYADKLPGYKDVKVNVDLPSGHKAEIIMATPEMLRAKEELGGHKLYEEARTTVDPVRLNELNQKMEKLYGEADAAAAKRLASAGATSEPSTKALAGAKGAPVSTTVPRTALPSDTTLTKTSSTLKNQVPGLVKSRAIKSNPSNNSITEKLDSLKQSKKEDAPTALKDALLAKQQKLQAAKTNTEAPKAKTAQPTTTHEMPEGNKQSRHANVTVQNSDKVNQNVKTLVAEKNVNYTPQSVEAGQKAASDFVSKEGLPKAQSHVVTNLHTTDDGKITRQDVYNAHAVADALQKTGKAEDAAAAADIYGRLSEHHTAAGQQIQAAAALAKISPQGLHQSAIKAITNGGKNGAKQQISEDLAAKISSKVDEIAQAAKQRDDHIDTANNATDQGARNAALNDANTADIAHNDRVQELQKIVNQNVHHSVGDKVFTLWRTGLLTGPQTLTKVAASHAIMAGAEKAKDPAAVAIDKAISAGSILTGHGPMRSTALTMRGTGSGFKTGTKAAVKLMRTGLDTKGTGGMGDTLAGKLAHPEVDYGDSKLGKAANFYVQKVGGMHASIPKGFFTAAQSNDLFKQAIAEGKNMGLSGRHLQLHVDNYVQGATDAAKQEAHLSAQRASFQQDTATGKIGRAMQSVPGGKYVMPFAKIASTILSDAADYSPAGAFKAGYQAFKESRGPAGWTPTVQKHFVEELGRSITGTGAIIAGAELYKHGVMTLGYPTNKPEREIWKAQGKTPNSILINGKWRDTSSLGPFGTLLFMGGSAAQSQSKDGKGRSQVGAAVTGALQNVTSQSYLSGLTSAANAISDPSQFAGSEEKQLAGSVVPIAVATAARATDSKQRNAPGVAQSVESKIPGLRETLTPAQDMFGKTLQREGGVATNLLDPSRPSGSQPSAQAQELQRLLTATGSTSVPTPVKTINGKDAAGQTKATALTQTQQNAFTAATGPKIQAAYKQIMNDPRYSQLSDANKVAALNAAKTNIEDQQKAAMLKSINGNTVKLTNAQANGVKPDFVQNKLNEQSGGTAGVPINAKLDSPSRDTLNKFNGFTAAERTKAAQTQNNFDYKVELAKYNNNIANGSLTDAQKVKAEASLGKAQVGADYSKNVRDLYGLSNAELTSYLNTPENGVDKQGLVKQIMSYGDALAAAGVAKNKFRSNKGVVTLGKTTATGTRSAKFKTVKIPGVKSNPYKTGGYRQSFKQARMPKIRSNAVKGSYKVAALKTNIDAKLKSRKA